MNYNDDFFTIIIADANCYHAKQTGNQLTTATVRAFIDNDIRTLDDLSDNDSEFTEQEYDAFDDALETYNAIEQRDAMEKNAQ